MIENRRILIIITTLIFSLGMVSVGYGFWTDRLDLEGEANVKISINVTDDIVNVEYTTPDGIQLFDVPMNLTDDAADVNNSSSSQGNSLNSIPAQETTDQGEIEEPTDGSEVINTEDQTSTTDTDDVTVQENTEDSSVQTGEDGSVGTADESNQEGEGETDNSTDSDTEGTSDSSAEGEGNHTVPTESLE